MHAIQNCCFGVLTPTQTMSGSAWLVTRRLTITHLGGRAHWRGHCPDDPDSEKAPAHYVGQSIRDAVATSGEEMHLSYWSGWCGLRAHRFVPSRCRALRKSSLKELAVGAVAPTHGASSNDRCAARILITRRRPPSTGGIQAHVAHFRRQLVRYEADVATLWLTNRTDWLLRTTVRLRPWTDSKVHGSTTTMSAASSSLLPPSTLLAVGSAVPPDVAPPSKVAWLPLRPLDQRSTAPPTRCWRWPRPSGRNCSPRGLSRPHSLDLVGRGRSSPGGRSATWSAPQRSRRAA